MGIVSTSALAAAGYTSRAATSESGIAFCRAALAEIAVRSHRGERCVVVFDIDNTLADTRRRTLVAAHAFGKENGIPQLANARLEEMRLTGFETARALGVSLPAATRFERAWQQLFWSAAGIALDRPMAGMIALARRAKAAGAEVVYLTGRNASLAAATRLQLGKFGLPDVDAAHVVCKPSAGLPTPEFKAGVFATLRAMGTQVGFFVTESRRDIGYLQAHQAHVPCVLLDFPLDLPGFQVHRNTPVVPLSGLG